MRTALRSDESQPSGKPFLGGHAAITATVTPAVGMISLIRAPSEDLVG